MKKKYLVKLITLSLFSLGFVLLSCSSTPEIYKPIELNSVKELETGQKIIYYSSDENLASYLKQRLEGELPIIDKKYELQNSLPVTFYIIPTSRDWKKYYCFGDTVTARASSRGLYEVFALTTNQYKQISEQYANNYIAHTGNYITNVYEIFAKRVAEMQ